MKAGLAKLKLKCVGLAWHKAARLLAIHKQSLAQSKANSLLSGGIKLPCRP